MSEISIPNPNRRRALILVDIQKGFLGEGNPGLVPNVLAVLEQARYDIYIVAVFHAEKGSLWDMQTDWTFPLELTVPEITTFLDSKGPIQVIKTTKSAFKGDKDLEALFKRNGIEEVHIVGLDTNDCVLATAYDAFDAGFFTYVIEECTGSSSGADMHQCGLKILRNTDLTNHSELIEKVEVIKI